ncbi:MAG: tetratricopeptide repeat protein [Spirochaetales bacterium]|nr:tetratricopeptide repeat protein [Spirochaetales bacterium]
MFLKNAFFLLVIIPLVCTLFGCRRTFDKELLEQIAEMQEPVFQGEKIRPEVLEQIKESILMYEEKIQDIVKASAQLGRYYRLLAKQYIEIEELKQEIALLKKTETQMLDESALESDPVFHSILFVEYMSYEMYEYARNEVKRALEIYPDNPMLHYYAGVCSARFGKSKTDTADQDIRSACYADALASYTRALELQSNHIASLKATAVLYIFELNLPEKALSYLERALTVEKNSSEVRFLLARVYYQAGDLGKAIEQYEIIAADGQSEVHRQSAKDNLYRLQEEQRMTR